MLQVFLSHCLQKAALLCAPLPGQAWASFYMKNISWLFLAVVKCESNQDRWGCTKEDRSAQPYGAYTQPCSFLHQAPPRYKSYPRAHFPGSAAPCSLGSQTRQAFLGKGEKGLGDLLSSGDPAAPTANSYKSSHILTTALLSTPPLAGSGPGCIKHVSAGQGWKVNKSASCVSIRAFFFFGWEQS